MLSESISDVETSLATFEKDTAQVDRFLALVKKYTDFSELTTPMINEFVDRIIVHTPDRSEDDRTQELEINLKYIGRFKVPMPDLPQRNPSVKSRSANIKSRAGNTTK